MKKYWYITIPVIILSLGSVLHYFRGYYGLGDSALFANGVDDAYITFRYGWNLTNFGTLSWNESGYRQTEGFTNPLWVLASAVWSLPKDKELVYPLSVITSIMVSGMFLIKLTFDVYRRNQKSIFSLTGMILVCALPPIWLHMSAGLESGVFGISLALLAYLVLFEEFENTNFVFPFTLTLLIGFLRSDGFIYLGIILISAIITGSKSWKAVAAGLLISSSIIFIWRYFTFGAILPNTAVAKVNFGVGERLPVGVNFFFSTLANSGLVIFLLFGIAGLWLEGKRQKIAGVFILISWIAYYLYIGGDVYVERHLIGMYFLCAAFSAPLWIVARPLARIVFFAAIISVAIISVTRYGNRFNYLSDKLSDPWIVLGQAIEADRDNFGVVISFAAGKIPFFAGGDFIDSIGLNDPLLATIKRESFVPGHSAGNEDKAIKIASSHPAGVYSMFSYLSNELIQNPDRIILWVDNFNPQQTARTTITEHEWEAALLSETQFAWSIISSLDK